MNSPTTANVDWGPIPLDTALTNSVNTWFGQLGQKLGQDKLFSMMEKFGFSSKPPIDLPEEEVLPSGVWDLEADKLLTRHDPVDLARVAIGQERLLVTPLQDAMVAAAVANGGKLMKPQIWKRVVNVDGSVTKTMDPSVYSEPIKSKTAEELTTAMEGVVERRDRDQRGDLRRQGGGQDRHRGNAEQQGLRRRRGREPGMVHGLRARRPPEDRDRRDGRVHEAVRQRRRRADLPRSGRNDPERRMRRADDRVITRGERRG